MSTSRLGFTLAGILRDAERYSDHRYSDLAVSGLLVSEWSGRLDGNRARR
jgi:RimJ/RimL family protein N-acetyltransferase